MNTGLFLRGRLLGVRPDKEIWTDKKTGELKERNYSEIGIEVDFVNKFGVAQKLTKSVRLNDTKANDAQFLKSIEQNYLKSVEISVYTMYGNIIVENSADFISLEQSLQKVG